MNVLGRVQSLASGEKVPRDSLRPTHKPWTQRFQGWAVTGGGLEAVGSAHWSQGPLGQQGLPLKPSPPWGTSPTLQADALSGHCSKKCKVTEHIRGGNYSDLTKRFFSFKWLLGTFQGLFTRHYPAERGVTNLKTSKQLWLGLLTTGISKLHKVSQWGTTTRFVKIMICTNILGRLA